MAISETHPTDAGLAALRASLDGDLVLPGDDGWDASRQPWQLLVDQHPTAVVFAATVADVGATMRTAGELRLGVAPQATGHSAGSIRTLDQTILLNTSRLRAVTVDADGRTARIEAGAAWADVVGVAAQHGLAPVSGMSPDVGVIGFTLGGGLGWLGRSHGLAANSVVAIDAVDASGETLRIDAQQHEDLFWALRGGVSPVIVTAIEIRLYPLPQIYAGALMWPIERAAEVAHVWREWVAQAPSSITSLVRVLRYPPMPELPPFLQGRAFVSVEAAIQEPADEAERMLQPLRDLAPEFDFVRDMPPTELGSIHGDPQQPVPAYTDSVLVTEITRESIDVFLESALDDAAAPLLSIEMRHLGGELSPGRAEGGAVSDLDGEGLVFVVGVVPAPELGPVVADAADRVLAGLADAASNRAFRNFHDRAVDPVALYGESLDRLRDVVKSWDPRGAIRAGHPAD